MTRVPLKAPLRPLIDDTLPENDVHRLWRHIQEARSRRPAPARRAWGLVLAGAFTMALAGGWILLSTTPTALEQAGGGELPASFAANTPRSFTLNDGSRIEVAGGGRLDVLESTDRAFVLALRQGSATFDVQPGGPRTWRIECGRVSIEVIGTRFVVARRDEGVRVDVERGAVLVRGEIVPDHVVRLGAGQSLSLPTGDAKVALPPEPPRATERPDVSKDPSAAPPGRLAPATARIADAPGPAPSARATSIGQSSARALFAEADAARRAGRTDEAIQLLGRVLAEYPVDPAAPLAEFTLGRLYVDSGRNAATAARHFTRALASGLPATLAEDAQARLVEAYVRAGNPQAAQEAAARYRALYPQGRRAHEVDRWVAAVP